MSGNPLVVGDGFVVDERALLKLGGGDDNAAGALAIWRAGDVVGGSGSLKRRYRFDGDWRLGKKSEELREFRFHLSDVVAEIVEDLVPGGRNVFGIGLERSSESGEVGETFFVGDRRHLGLNAVDLAQAELVDLVRRHVGGGPPIDVVLVALLAVCQG